MDVRRPRIYNTIADAILQIQHGVSNHRLSPFAKPIGHNACSQNWNCAGRDRTIITNNYLQRIF